MGYKDADALLQNPPGRFVPRDSEGKEIPFRQVAKHCVEFACRRRDALLPGARAYQGESKEAQAAALQHYRRAFGQINKRTFRELAEEIIRRDAGENRFDDPALYFRKVVVRAEAKPKDCETPNDRSLRDKLNALANPSGPTATEQKIVWNNVCQLIAEHIQKGGNRSEGEFRAFGIILSTGANLSATPSALRKMIRRKYDRWAATGGSIEALDDQRAARFKRAGFFRAPDPTENDLLVMKGKARIHCGGRLDQAWRELIEAKQLSEPLFSYYRRAQRMPRRLREMVAADVVRMKNIHRGKRCHKLNGAYIDRSWANVAPGDWRQGDDVTLPVWWYVPDGDWFQLMRGQFLLMCDEGTGYITHFSLLPKPTYSQLDIRSLITRDAAIHGLPRRGYKFELGTWRSKILVGNQTINPGEIAEAGLAKFGLKVERTLLPRGKIIERTIGQLQDYMEHLPGYSSRDERRIENERFERLKLDIKSRAIDPRDGRLLSQRELVCEVQHIVDRYNNRPQFGKKLKGISPYEAWASQAGKHEPLVKFDARTHYFLASEVRRPLIGRNGITFAYGKERFCYKGEETGQLRGEKVWAWFNSDQPQFLACSTDLDGTCLFVLERSHDVPAHDASKQLLDYENKKIAEHQRYAETLYSAAKNVLPPHAFRGNVASPSTVDLGNRIETGVGKKEEARQSRVKLEAKVRRRAARAGIPMSNVRVTEDAANALEGLGNLRAEFDKLIAEEKQ
jgi:hypothetical protein